MRASEFVNESKKGSVPKRHHKSQPGAYTFTDDGTDRTYNLNQIMKAVAMSDGSSTKALDMDSESFAGKHNMAYPYSPIEHTMMQQAFNTVSPTSTKHIIDKHKSSELDSVHKVSPMNARRDYRKK